MNGQRSSVSLSFQQSECFLVVNACGHLPYRSETESSVLLIKQEHFSSAPTEQTTSPELYITYHDPFIGVLSTWRTPSAQSSPRGPAQFKAFEWSSVAGFGKIRGHFWEASKSFQPVFFFSFFVCLDQFCLVFWSFFKNKIHVFFKFERFLQSSEVFVKIMNFCEHFSLNLLIVFTFLHFTIKC